MPLVFEIRIEPGLVLETGEGTIAPDDLLGVRRREAEHPDFAACRVILTDAQRVTDPQVTPTDLRALAAYIASRQDVYAGKRWAFVMDHPRATGLALLLQQLFTESGLLEAKVFATMTAAREWLGLDPPPD
ncbi:MAG TPA: hypothetical protein VKA86_11355 [Candidatus Krumholzibacteria bacterium]|nr:hypothetical protein [Candidatus Krumholzibacteria bacterium]